MEVGRKVNIFTYTSLPVSNCFKWVVFEFFKSDNVSFEKRKNIFFFLEIKT